MLPAKRNASASSSEDGDGRKPKRGKLLSVAKPPSLSSSSSSRMLFADDWKTLPKKLFLGARSDFAFAKLGDELFFMGGLNVRGSPLATTVSYNCTTRSWTRRRSMPEPLKYCAGAAVDDHRIIVVGGYWNRYTTFLYNNKTNSWSILPDLNERRVGVACVCVNDKVYVMEATNSTTRDQ